MAIKDGGPAFPTFELERVYADEADRIGRQRHVPVDGMSLRDHFAGQALMGGINEFFSAGDTWSGYGDFAASCYAMADAMLRAREVE